jgi:EAL domain-containing protein (putative c-di-GMP-specific phosphodiesterase class I)
MANVARPPDGSVPVRTLTEQELFVLFQPIVDLQTGEILAHEALVRCRDPSYPTPEILFERASAEGAEGYLGATIRRLACAGCPDSALFINVHPAELSARWLVRPDDPVAFHEPGVYLEITEAAAFEYFDLCMSVLREIRGRAGVHLVVDDLGAGHSTIARVLELQPSIVKLDGELVTGIDQDAQKQRVVAETVTLCQSIGAAIVAEHIERPEEIETVRQLGIRYGQGYLFAAPAVPAPTVAWRPAR